LSLHENLVPCTALCNTTYQTQPSRRTAQATDPSEAGYVSAPRQATDRSKRQRSAATASANAGPRRTCRSGFPVPAVCPSPRKWRDERDSGRTGGWRAAVVRSRGRLAGAARVLPCATESARRGNRRRRCRCCLALRAQAPVDDIPTRRPGEGDRPARRLAIQPHTRALRRRCTRCSELVAPTDAIARPRQGRPADLPAARISSAWLGFRP